MGNTNRLERDIGDFLICNISGIETVLQRVEGKYDYENGDKSTCPVCGNLGVPWGGLFHCEGPHRAVIETGQCFVIYKEVP